MAHQIGIFVLPDMDDKRGWTPLHITVMDQFANILTDMTAPGGDFDLQAVKNYLLGLINGLGNPITQLNYHGDLDGATQRGNVTVTHSDGTTNVMSVELGKVQLGQDGTIDWNTYQQIGLNANDIATIQDILSNPFSGRIAWSLSGDFADDKNPTQTELNAVLARDYPSNPAPINGDVVIISTNYNDKWMSDGTTWHDVNDIPPAMPTILGGIKSTTDAGNGTTDGMVTVAPGGAASVIGWSSLVTNIANSLQQVYQNIVSGNAQVQAITNKSGGTQTLNVVGSIVYINRVSGDTALVTAAVLNSCLPSPNGDGTYSMPTVNNGGTVIIPDKSYVDTRLLPVQSQGTNGTINASDGTGGWQAIPLTYTQTAYDSLLTLQQSTPGGQAPAFTIRQSNNSNGRARTITISADSQRFNDKAITLTNNQSNDVLVVGYSNIAYKSSNGAYNFYLGRSESQSYECLLATSQNVLLLAGGHYNQSNGSYTGYAGTRNMLFVNRSYYSGTLFAFQIANGNTAAAANSSTNVLDVLRFVMTRQGTTGSGANNTVVQRGGIWVAPTTQISDYEVSDPNVPLDKAILTREYADQRYAPIGGGGGSSSQGTNTINISDGSGGWTNAANWEIDASNPNQPMANNYMGYSISMDPQSGISQNFMSSFMNVSLYGLQVSDLGGNNETTNVTREGINYSGMSDSDYNQFTGSLGLDLVKDSSELYCERNNIISACGDGSTNWQARIDHYGYPSTASGKNKPIALTVANDITAIGGQINALSYRTTALGNGTSISRNGCWLSETEKVGSAGYLPYTYLDPTYELPYLLLTKQTADAIYGQNVAQIYQLTALIGADLSANTDYMVAIVAPGNYVIRQDSVVMVTIKYTGVGTPPASQNITANIMLLSNNTARFYIRNNTGSYVSANSLQINTRWM